MKLKAIEMQGFKSFADRTELTFNGGITAIVGPNGSGKSNVSDAVQWVFGEQSMKTLRGSKMEDVIFSGTPSRKALNSAWVTLTIDNSDRTMKYDADEIQVTRKLWRNGESEYKINGQTVRMRDVTELFMDTGLGRDGYAIVGQGKIADIVAAKSGQRREIFEEAAGIARYRYRRGEAERRLEQAEENLLRLRDIQTEKESRLGPLKTQAEKAEKYLVLSEEKKGLELSLWLMRLEELQTRLQELEDSLLSVRRVKKSAQTDEQELESEEESISRKIQEADIQADTLRREIREAETRASAAEVESAVQNNEISHYRDEITRLNHELTQNTGSSGELKEQSEATAEKIAGMERKVRETQEELNGSLARGEELRKEQIRLETRLEGIQTHRESLRLSIAQNRTAEETSSTLAQEAAERLEALKAQLEQHSGIFAQLEQETAQNRDFISSLRRRQEELSNSGSGYQVKLRSRQEKLSELQDQLRELELSIREKTQKAQLLSDLEKNLEGFYGSVKAVMKQARSGALKGVEGTVSELIQVESRYAAAIEIALGAGLQNIVTADEAAAKRAIAYLSNSKAGRATFLPLTTVRGTQLREPGLEQMDGCLGIAAQMVQTGSRMRGIVDFLLGKTILAEDLDAAAEIAKATGHRYKVVTLDGQVVNAGGSMTGGYAGKSGSILSRKNEIAQLQARAEELTFRRQEAEKQYQSRKQETAALEAAFAGIQAEIRTIGEDFASAMAESKRLELSRAEAQQRAEEGRRELESLAERRSELEKKHLSSADLVSELERELEQTEQELLAVQAERTKLEERIAANREETAGLQLRKGWTEKDLTVLRKEQERLLAQQRGSEEQAAILRAETQALEEKIQELTALMEEKRQESIQLKVSAAEKNRAIRELSVSRQNLELRQTELRKAAKEAAVRRENASSELARLEERRDRVMQEQESILNSMEETYQLTRSEAASAAVPIEDTQTAQRRLSELKGKIRSMGAVNINAVGEYQELLQEYEFLHAQISDVENAKAELQNMIASLTETMGKMFVSTFQSISKEFSRIFRELFGGGKGELQLTDPEHPLETGIEISVQPPGKIIRNLASLSGGEQSFVAVCIYFAILKVSPAPFVLMDEIEAALDDVNVARYASYLHRMTGKTQFITITHRRGTMEAADVLYGVTMEEQGISRLLRLDVGELEEKLHLTETGTETTS